MDIVFIQGLKIDCVIGIYDWEREIRQEITLDIEMSADIKAASETDHNPRTQGSNNPGATNVLRIGGKKAAAITLIGDGVKGAIPVLIAHTLGSDLLTIV
jgi:hypothetical protein